MKRDEIATGEALPDGRPRMECLTEADKVEVDDAGGGIDVTPIVGARQTSLSPDADAALREIETRAFRHYQRAHAANQTAPTLHSAAALVRAWNAYADIMGIERV